MKLIQYKLQTVICCLATCIATKRIRLVACLVWQHPVLSNKTAGGCPIAIWGCMKDKTKLQPCDMVIFGGTGDLCLRKIIPALYYRLKEQQLPDSSRIWLLGRSPMSDAQHKQQVRTACEQYIPAKDFNDADWQRLSDRVHYLAVEATAEAEFMTLKRAVDDDPRPVRVFYLSTPSTLFGGICTHLKACGLLHAATRVVLEKPLGHDLASFRRINAEVMSCLDESQIYRIDHYLGKEAVQNLLVLRFANPVFERIWSGDVVDHVQITVAESTGLENRHSYYDDAGALRDMVQNHLLQLLCLIAMEPPNQITAQAIRDEKLKVLRALRPITPEMVASHTVRGQYQAGMIHGKAVPAYREEASKPDSNTESFVALKAQVDNWRWSGIPFYMRTGKRMPQRYSEIVIQFRPVPHAIFPNQQQNPAANKLIIRLQPDEYIKLALITKSRGPGGYRLKPVSLNLSLADEAHERSPDAYERLLMDVVRGNQTLFMSNDELEAAWRWVESIMHSWDVAHVPLHHYVAGSKGPAEASVMIARDEREWHHDE